MPAIDTTNASLENESMKFFHHTLNMLLKDNISQYNASSLSGLMDYLTRFVNFNTLSEDDLNKLISIHAKFSSIYCAENFSSNQTMPNSYPHFTNFTMAIQDKEDFFHPSYSSSSYQTRLKENCETTLNNDAHTPFSFTSKMLSSIIGGAVIGTSHAATAIALQSAKNKSYTKNQLRVLKAGSDALNILASASYASMAAYMESSHESKDVIIEKMCQSFALSLAGNTSLYALTNSISYFAKSLESKLAKSFLNVLPLVGNVCLLAKNGNNLTETATMLGTQLVTAGLFTTAIQTGWCFFSKQHKVVQNTDLELGSISNAIETSSPNSIPNPVVDPFYENTNEQVTYASLESLDKEGYLIPNTLNTISSSTPGPDLPDRNLRFLASGGLNVNALSNNDDNNTDHRPIASSERSF